MNKMIKNRWGKIGVVGGAGPAASCLLYRLIIRSCQTRYGCKNDKDFPEMFILNYPFSEMVNPKQAVTNGDQIERELQACLDVLRVNQCTAIGIACNTLHTFLSDRAATTGIVGIDSVAKDSISMRKIERTLVLGTSTTAKSNLYRSTQTSAFVFPEDWEQDQITTIIDRILAGYINETDAITLREVVLRANQQKKVDAALLACTELSVLVDEYPITIYRVPIIDPLPLLANSLLVKSTHY